ncbi:hypothetical protein [Paenibacillus cremeus]|uniref:Uncharacterized protein n=1 Tax=Paenibacillus cremeus TaxID=2163881 RepID=A0A559KAD0_9BACL|nr:hypothetical protein [Paenibacillus cremeus]TVY09086.1 hypothetical protein FPZ49_15360 [Paenibacillus cremeus]
MIELPVSFDANEWFILSSLIITYGLMLLLPKRFPRTITILLFLFTTIIAKMFDLILATPPYDLYDINDTPGYELFDLFTWFLYPPFGYFLVYLYDRWHLNGIYKWFYILAFSMFSVGFEWLTNQFHVYQYNGWNVIYSLPIYLIVICFTLLYYHFIKWYFLKTINR